METLNTTRITITNIYKTCFSSKSKLTSRQKINLLKGDLLALYLIAIRLYYVVYN
ncbi:hypothetical protein AAFN85_20900 [Mucilaginibacter sp. CAU 1740]|uniref:hypothetical protein n=1 Tax=Mucilaginibacter sp. CAU 1740 TaxID=3140365 RepID=UPI00325BA860